MKGDNARGGASPDHGRSFGFFGLVNQRIRGRMEMTFQGNSPAVKRWLLIAGLVAAVILLGLYLPIKDITIALLEWIDSLGFLGYVIFFFIYAFFTVLFLPGFILTVGAGAVFGLPGGFVAVSLGSTVGASLAFLLGRFFARDWVARKISGNKKFAAIDRAVARRGWKIVFLTRLSPVFPFNLINYAYGLTKIPFWHYAFSSWIGMMPGTVLYVYMGSLAGTVARAVVAEQRETGLLEMTSRVIGLLATLAVTVYITQIARKALKEDVPLEETDAEKA